MDLTESGKPLKEQDFFWRMQFELWEGVNVRKMLNIMYLWGKLSKLTHAHLSELIQILNHHWISTDIVIYLNNVLQAFETINCIIKGLCMFREKRRTILSCWLSDPG